MVSPRPAHRHGRRVHSHAHAGIHRHLYALQTSRALASGAHAHEHPRGLAGGHGHGDAHGHAGHGHIHGLADPSILRSRAGIRAVALSLAVLGLTAALQALIYAASGSVALLADLIHKAGDALTAIPLGVAFFLRSGRGERAAGLAIVVVILFSACVAGYLTLQRLLHPHTLSHLGLLIAAGTVGFFGNEIAARVRLRAGRRLESPALLADGQHARIDAFVSLGVVASALLAEAGATIGDPIIGLLIIAVILRVSWQSWTTISRGRHPRDGASEAVAARDS